MGKDDHIVVIPEKVVGEVRNIPPVASVEELLHGLRIHELTTSKVEKDSIILHGIDDLLVDHTVRASLASDVGDVQRDVICGSNGFLDGVSKENIAGKLHGILDRKIGVVSNSLHAEGEGRVAGCLGADIAKADNSESLPLEFPATKHRLVLLNALLGNSLTSKLLHVVDPVDDATRTNQHTAEYKLLDGICVGTGGVEDRNTKLSHTSDGDVVYAGSAASDSTACLGNVFLLELMGT
mmetsp:Transcript_1970/g.3284  ORF Transcript_1970/g.3284 Transcript_1970/m.3284 type:complete len:238 (-) Transcript_1970:421-1134(-)